MRTFEARYPGRCGSCDERFEDGDLVGYIEGELCCLACCDDEEAS